MIKTTLTDREKDVLNYMPSEALKITMDMALELKRPLLLAGKPGTGKTDFGHWFVGKTNQEMRENKKEPEFNGVLQFNTKSTSLYNDLFYVYDALSHFRAIQTKKNVDVDVCDFIKLTELGKAIIFAKGKDIEDENLKKIVKSNKLDLDNVKTKSLVIIDEIDKAPRDFPNDLLHEIEHYSFCIKETSPIIEVKLDGDEKKNVIVLLTSNDEKNLPDAFLRRCLFHYIDFPDGKTLKKIILCKLLGRELSNEEKELIDQGMELQGFGGLNDKIDIFYKIFENNSIEKKAYTGECIQWINYLYQKKLLHLPVYEYQFSLAALLKKNEDFQEAVKMLDKIKEEKARETRPEDLQKIENKE